MSANFSGVLIFALVPGGCNRQQSQPPASDAGAVKAAATTGPAAETPLVFSLRTPIMVHG
jgi:hypothetical protein